MKGAVPISHGDLAELRVEKSFFDFFGMFLNQDPNTYKLFRPVGLKSLSKSFDRIRYDMRSGEF